MRKLVAAGVAGLLLVAGQTPVAGQTNGQPEVGSRAFCDAQWKQLVQSNATGGVTEKDFMQGCVTQPVASRSGGGNNGLVYVAGGVGLLLLVGLAAGLH